MTSSSFDAAILRFRIILPVVYLLLSAVLFLLCFPASGPLRLVRLLLTINVSRLAAPARCDLGVSKPVLLEGLANSRCHTNGPIALLAYCGSILLPGEEVYHHAVAGGSFKCYENHQS
jgi:hypothetical protein